MTRYKSQDRFYYNLNKETFSVQEKVKGRWKVNKERYSNRIIVDNPTFKVSEAGRQRVLRDKRKKRTCLRRGHSMRSRNRQIPINRSYLQPLQVF